MDPSFFQLPGCTSCTRTAAWLSAHGVAVHSRHIRRAPPTRQELAAMADLHPDGPWGLLSTRSVRYRELGLAGRTLRADELLDLLAGEPRLLRRPLLCDGERLVVGFDRPGLERLLAPGGD